MLLGPARAINYVLAFGVTGFTLGVLWSSLLPWWITLPACTGVAQPIELWRTVGILL